MSNLTASTKYSSAEPQVNSFQKVSADRKTELQPYAIGQYVWLRRPKAWKFGPKWLGPWLVLARLGVNYRIKSDEGQVLVVHHGHLKPYFMPTGQGKIVCPGQETVEYNIVPVLPSKPNGGAPELDIGPRVRPARLRQCIRPRKRYGHEP